MPTAFIISTGSELLTGQIADSNSAYLTARLMDMGFSIQGKVTVGDDVWQLQQVFDLAVASADLIISTGGLGPTFDDLTKSTACRVVNCDLELRQDELNRLEKWFAQRNRPMPEINRQQAMFPRESTVLRNEMGTAPGMYLNKDHKILVLLPGPPREMIPMFISQVEPLLKQDISSRLQPLIRKTIKVMGMGESQVEERLGDLIRSPGLCTKALLASEGEIQVRLSVQDGSGSEELAHLAGLITDRLGRHVFGFDNDTLVTAAADLLVMAGAKLAVAESCTGGLLSKMITDLPGSSSFYWGGVVSYSNEAKQHFLDVKEQTLDQNGAVSPAAAEEMARGILKASGVDYALAITGIAGPDGGTDLKPVGLVYIALASQWSVETRELRLSGGRDLIRIIAAKSALDLLRRRLDKKFETGE